MILLLTTILVSLSPVTQGSGDEISLAEDAVEPTIAANRLPPPFEDILVVAYMKTHATGGIVRRRSTDQGVSFSDPLGVDLNGGFALDPTLAANPLERHLLSELAGTQQRW